MEGVSAIFGQQSVKVTLAVELRCLSDLSAQPLRLAQSFLCFHSLLLSLFFLGLRDGLRETQFIVRNVKEDKLDAQVPQLDELSDLS